MSARQFVLVAGPLRQRIADNLARCLAELPADQPWRVTIEPQRRQRSDEANAYLWGVAYRAMAQELGHTADEWHQYMCGDYFGWRDRPLPGGRVESVPVRTTTRDEHGKRAVLSTAEFAAFIEHVQMRAAEAGVYVPSPNE